MVPLRAAAMAITLLSFCLLATLTSAANRKCCLNYTKAKIPFEPIRGFSIQTDKARCHIKAIIFHTPDRKVCADPALVWVMDYVNRIRIKALKVHDNTSKALK